MPKINPIGVLNSKAHSMITGLITDSPYKQEYVSDFFAIANKYDVQGQALLSYYTALNNIKNDKTFTKKHGIDRIKNLERYVGDLIAGQTNSLENNPNKDVLDHFTKKLNELYNKNLRIRISLANQGAVSAEKLVPVAFGSKAMVRINLFLDKLFQKGNEVYNKISKMCEPVE